MTVFEIQGWIMIVVSVLLLAVALFAFMSSLTFSAQSYEAAGKLNKPTWTIILGLGLLLNLMSLAGLFGSMLLGLIFTIAAFVYLADVRPALKGLYRRR